MWPTASSSRQHCITACSIIRASSTHIAVCLLTTSILPEKCRFELILPPVGCCGRVALRTDCTCLIRRSSGKCRKRSAGRYTSWFAFADHVPHKSRPAMSGLDRCIRARGAYMYVYIWCILTYSSLQTCRREFHAAAVAMAARRKSTNKKELSKAQLAAIARRKARKPKNVYDAEKLPLAEAINILRVRRTARTNGLHPANMCSSRLRLHPQIQHTSSRSRRTCPIAALLFRRVVTLCPRNPSRRRRKPSLRSRRVGRRNRPRPPELTLSEALSLLTV